MFYAARAIMRLAYRIRAGHLEVSFVLQADPPGPGLGPYRRIGFECHIRESRNLSGTSPRACNNDESRRGRGQLPDKLRKRNRFLLSGVEASFIACRRNDRPPNFRGPVAEPGPRLKRLP